MKHLHDLEPAEVSLVAEGANRRRFLILKKQGEKMTNQDLLDAIQEEPASMEAVEKVLKSFNSDDEDTTSAAIKAVVRILNPLKESLNPTLLQKSLQAAGILMSKQKTQGDPMPIKEEHKVEALKRAKGAHDEYLKELGVTEAFVLTQKSIEEEIPKVTPKDDEKEDVLKSLLAGVPKESRAALEQIFKAQESLVKKNEQLATELSVVRKAAKRKEFVAKAQGYKHLGVATEELADTLMSLSETNPTEYSKIESIITAADTQIAKGNLFSEFGSSHAGKGGTTWEQIEQSAMARVAKTGEKLSKEQALTAFMATPEGLKMYNAYTQEKGNK